MREFSFILDILRRDCLVKELRERTRGFCWDLFLERVFSEGLAGLVFFEIKKRNLKEIFPSKVLLKLEDFYLTNLGRNLLIHKELEELFNFFESKNLTCFLNRGGFFSKYLYPSLGIRPLVDVDLVIFKEDLNRFKEVFLDSGYNYYCDYPFFFFKDSFYIDLHLDKPGFWRIDSWPSEFTIRNIEVQKRSRPLKEEFSKVRIFDSYDLILSSCQHLQEHSFSKLIWFMDVVKLIEASGEEFSWPILEERAKDFNLKKSLHFVVKYLQEKKLIALSPEEKILNSSLNFLERKSLNFLISERRENISGEILFLFSLKGFRRRLNFLKETFLLKEEFFPLTEKPNIFFYFFRSVKILGYILKRLVKLICLKLA